MSLLFSNPKTAANTRCWVHMARTVSSTQAVWLSLLKRYFPTSPFSLWVTSSMGKDGPNDLIVVMAGDEHVVVMEARPQPATSVHRHIGKHPVKLSKPIKGEGVARVTHPDPEASLEHTVPRCDIRTSRVFQYIQRIARSNNGSPVVGIVGMGPQFLLFEVSWPQGGGSGGICVQVSVDKQTPKKTFIPNGAFYCIVDHAEALDTALRRIKDKAISSSKEPRLIGLGA